MFNWNYLTERSKTRVVYKQNIAIACTATKKIDIRPKNKLNFMGYRRPF